ncbi:Endonuclease/exonuclease/phosphatase superfamily [Sesbania bispinosa]|nr:Endonuclease/exonuclease/phosphatase superfamily [Sesbania bispinosa]
MAAASTIRELQALCAKHKSHLVFLSETRATRDKEERNHWECTFIYGHPKFQERRNLWSSLKLLHINTSTPWCCFDDFNELLSQAEKVGLQPHPPNRSELFRDFLNDSGLMDLELKGWKFTWCSNPRNRFITKEKLDRVMVNWAWRTMFEHATTTSLQSPQTTPQLSYGPNLKILVVVPSNMRQCGRNTRRWEMSSKMPRQQMLKEIIVGNDLGRKSKNVPANLKRGTRKNFRKRGKDFVNFNNNWSSYKARIKDGEDHWVEGQKEISNAILQHFRKIYSKDPCSNVLECIQATPKLVPEVLLRQLQNQVSENEIKEAVFDLGALKAPRPDGYNG